MLTFPQRPSICATGIRLKSVALFVVVMFMAIAMIGPTVWLNNCQSAGASTTWQKTYDNNDAYETFDMVEYKNRLYLAVGGVNSWAKIKRYDGGNSWTQVNINGFGKFIQNPYSMAVFNGLLYVGTDGPPTTGAEVWAYNGSNWTQVNESGFGDFDDECRILTVYNNHLYAVANGGSGKFRVYRYSGSGKTWTRVDTEAWDSSNHDGLCAISFNSCLWIGTHNESTGTEIWRYDGNSWSQVNQNGFGKSDLECRTLAVYKNQLYAGTGNSPTRGKVYRYNSGTSWTQISPNGFGDICNYFTLSLASYGGKLWAGTKNRPNGCEMWSYNGSTWTQENENGFGDGNNTEATSMIVFQNCLYVGTSGYSAQVWRSGGAPPPSTPYAVYLAEGSTDYGFSEYISIENPNPAPVTIKLTYQTKSGPVGGPQIVMPAMSQATVNPADIVGANDFSTKVECLDGKRIAADRTMTWTGPGAASEEAHSSIGVTSPSKTWYLPEGSSKWGFETWLLIQNPNSTEAQVKITYMIEDEGPKTVKKTVPANSRQTFSMTNHIGEKDASIKVESDIPVIPERSMYRNNKREGHCSIGTTTPHIQFFLPEGSTAWGFTTYIIIQNPNDTPTKVNITYLTKNRDVWITPATFEMPPNSRKTIRVNDDYPNMDMMATRVDGLEPIIAERAMYWDNGTGEACHDSIGISAPHTFFYLPDGETTNGRETWTLILNPNYMLPSPDPHYGDVEVEISYLKPDGQGNVVFTDTIPGGTRRTYNMADKGISGRAAVMVKSKTAGKKIMVERAMYWNNRGAGTDTIGGYSDWYTD